jgi:hypothetical protein
MCGFFQVFYNCDACGFCFMCSGAGGDVAAASNWWSGAAAPPTWASYMPLEEVLNPGASATWGATWVDMTVILLHCPPAPHHGVTMVAMVRPIVALSYCLVFFSS